MWQHFANLLAYEDRLERAREGERSIATREKIHCNEWEKKEREGEREDYDT